MEITDSIKTVLKGNGVPESAIVTATELKADLAGKFVFSDNQEFANTIIVKGELSEAMRDALNLERAKANGASVLRLNGPHTSIAGNDPEADPRRSITVMDAAGKTYTVWVPESQLFSDGKTQWSATENGVIGLTFRPAGMPYPLFLTPVGGTRIKEVKGYYLISDVATVKAATNAMSKAQWREYVSGEKRAAELAAEEKARTSDLVLYRAQLNAENNAINKAAALVESGEVEDASTAQVDGMLARYGFTRKVKAVN